MKSQHSKVLDLEEILEKSSFPVALFLLLLNSSPTQDGLLKGFSKEKQPVLCLSPSVLA